MTDLCDKRRNALGADDLIAVHGGVLHRCKNAGNVAGVREDLQQLLRGDGQSQSPDMKKPAQGGFSLGEAFITTCQRR